MLLGIDKSSRRDLILLNAAAILYLADKAKDIRDGYELARQSLDSGEAMEKLRQLIVSSGGEIGKLESIVNPLLQ